MASLFFYVSCTPLLATRSNNLAPNSMTPSPSSLRAISLYFASGCIMVSVAVPEMAYLPWFPNFPCIYMYMYFRLFESFDIIIHFNIPNVVSAQHSGGQLSRFPSNLLKPVRLRCSPVIFLMNVQPATHKLSLDTNKINTCFSLPRPE